MPRGKYPRQNAAVKAAIKASGAAAPASPPAAAAPVAELPAQPVVETPELIDEGEVARAEPPDVADETVDAAFDSGDAVPDAAEADIEERQGADEQLLLEAEYLCEAELYAQAQAEAQARAEAARQAQLAVTRARKPHRFADHAKSRDIDSLSGDELRDYAREIGMSKRDCAELGEDRLRAGCKAHLAHHFDELLAD